MRFLLSSSISYRANSCDRCIEIQLVTVLIQSYKQTKMLGFSRETDDGDNFKHLPS